jgi:hypothetical protein
MKTCFKCRVEKPLTEFYKGVRMNDGHVGKCKECNKSDVNQNRKDNIAHYKAYDKKRGFRETDIKKIRARGATRNLDRPTCCSQCKKEGKVDGHHPDYDKPLSVIWLCRSCHMLEHV